MNKYKEMTLEKFIEILGSDKSVPGGGGSAGLIGAIGNALVSMALHISEQSSDNYLWGKNDLIEDLEYSSDDFLNFINEDAESFLPLLRSYKMSNSDPLKKYAIETSAFRACMVPIKTMNLCIDVIEIIKIIMENNYCSKNLYSDIYCGLISIYSAFKMSYINVLINTKIMKNTEAKNVVESKCNQQYYEYTEMYDKLCADIENKMGVTLNV